MKCKNFLFFLSPVCDVRSFESSLTPVLRSYGGRLVYPDYESQPILTSCLGHRDMNMNRGVVYDVSNIPKEDFTKMMNYLLEESKIVSYEQIKINEPTTERTRERVAFF